MKDKADLYKFFDSKVKKFYTELDKCIANPGIDEIHDTRVASRRLYTYLSGFSPLIQSEALSKYLKSLKKTLGLFGRIRELDICCFITDKFISTYKIKPGIISELSSQILNERNKKYRNLFSDNAFQTVVLERDEISELIRINLSDLSLKGKTDNSGFILNFLSSQLNAYFEKFLNPPLRQEELSEIDIIHSKRVKAKGIRYLTELINELFGNILENHTAKLKNFTDTSGDLHDYDVLKGLYNRYLSKLIEFKNDETLYADGQILKFNSYLSSKIELLIGKTQKITVQIESEKFRDSIFSVITRQISNP